MEEFKTIKIIAEYKAMEENNRLSDARKQAQNAREHERPDDEKFWEDIAERHLAKWSAFTEMAEAIDLYLK